jgi:hypothetical protein
MTKPVCKCGQPATHRSVPSAPQRDGHDTVRIAFFCEECAARERDVTLLD